MQLNEAIENNSAWAAKRVAEDPAFFNRLARGQKPKDLGNLTSWLQNIRDVYRLHSHELDSIENEEIRYRRLVELNVHEQCINLLKVAEVQNAYSSANLLIAGWVFDMATGRVVDLKLDIEQIVGSIRDIYSIAEKV